MRLQDVAPNLGRGDTDGVNEAYEALVFDKASAAELADLLERDPRGVIRRAIRMDSTQRKTLATMGPKDAQELVAPVIEALRGSDPLAARFAVGVTDGQGTTAKRKTKITIEIG
jgi:hypothetical protein